MKRKLTFREDGTFKIVQFSDTELLDEFDYDPETPEYDAATLSTMETIILTEQPDLVVFAGDVIASNRAKDPIKSMRDAVSVVERLGVSWAAVFGNHDSEGVVPRKAMHEEQLKHPYNVALADPEDVSGAGNYVLTVTDESGKPAAAHYFLDSGDYPAHGSRVGGYAWIRRDQIDWYTKQSRELTLHNGGKPLPALAFFHIPLPEYNEVWDFHVCRGYRYDGYCASPQINSGFFTAMVEMGDVMGTFVGHDHANDFVGELHGIKLCYGRSTRYVSFIDGVRNDRMPVGARVIQLKAGERKFDTWIRDFEGNVVLEQPEHLPEGRKA
ncbi:metallophosphoesterase family protein [Bacillus sp. FJAT-28004]|uniref:metallophosphoesterase family protein n=1 Tax=Bacillus sp. FJAT-28004 TaxID=1679165 RepID=UPI0006B567B8|nr:metallophosphoesterase family protein [Bacillus sp. FJAT-28004]